MAINKNHEFEELDGVKCAIVEKNASAERAAFLKDLLEINGFKVIIVPSPVAKTAPPKAVSAPQPPNIEPPAFAKATEDKQTLNPEPSTFTIGVTNLAFNPTNAIFGRLLKTKDGHIVTPAYWHQKEEESRDDIPYYETKF
jgi:hypothetical protein